MNAIDLSPHEDARQALGHQAAVLAFGGFLAALVFRLLGNSFWAWAVATAVALGALCAAVVLRRLTRLAGELLFAATALSATFATLISAQEMADGGQPFVPFLGIRVVALIVALFAPSLSLGVFLIGFAMVAPVAQSFVLWSAAVRSRAPAIEPWQTVLAGLVSLGVLVAQRRYASLVRQLARVQADRHWLIRSARLARSVRDLTNSPLQALWLCVALVKKSHPHDFRAARTMDAALEQLRALNDALTPLDRVVPWEPIDLSFDALSRIDEQVHEALRATRAARPPHEPPPLIRGLNPRGEAQRALIHLSWACVAIGIIGMAVYTSAGLSTWQLILVAGVGTLGLGLGIAIPRLHRATSLALFSLEGVCAIIAAWIGSDVLASSERPFDPFNGTKIIALVVALVGPTPWLSAALIVLATVGPLVQAAFWTEEIRRQMAPLEPWATLLIGAVSLGLLWARRRHAVLARAMAVAQVERAWLERIARLALAICDLTRAPLEAMRAGSRETRLDMKGGPRIANQIDRAVARIQRLTNALAPLESILQWRLQRGEDAMTLLEREVREHLTSNATTDDDDLGSTRPLRRLALGQNAPLSAD
jgi:hypothetical protein